MPLYSNLHRRYTSRRARPVVECLDPRQLLATSGHTLGPFINPVQVNPRVTHPVVRQDTPAAINNYLAAILGETQLVPIQHKVHNKQTGTQVALAQRVLNQPFVASLFSNRDTYTLLNSPAVQQVIGVQVTSDQAATEETVRYLLPNDTYIVERGTDTATVRIPENQGIPGFEASVPLGNLRFPANGTVTVDVPRSQIPANAPAPLVINTVTGQLKGTYQGTGPILQSALLTGVHTITPNAPRTVPGLRLSKQLGSNRAFPVGVPAGRLQRLMRVAVQRGVFTANAENQGRINAALVDFLQNVNGLQQTGYFSPDAPPVAPAPVTGPLTGTLIVTSAAFRDLNSTSPGTAGLPLALLNSGETINLRGRIDVGFVISRNGDYGLILIAHGRPMADPKAFASQDTIGGDIQIAVSNTTSLSALNGKRVEESLNIGAALSSSLHNSNQNGVAIWGATVGYGSGFQYGTSNTFTQVIPLGNINALIPQHPRH
jgi:hypothetical protein